MFDIGDVEREWANVCPVDARSTEIVRAARRLPAHRREPHAEFSAGVFWKLVAFHPDPVRLLCRGLDCVDHQTSTTNNLISEVEGLAPLSYVVAAVASIASRISQSFRLHVTLGGIAMRQAILVHLCGLAALKYLRSHALISAPACLMETPTSPCQLDALAPISTWALS